VQASVERETVDAKVSFKILGVSKNSGYAAIQNGTFPLRVIHCGRRLLISKSSLRRLLGEGKDGDSEG
jgi:hypothetical protein